MDARENLLRVVRFERPDYIPMTFHINDACWHHYPSEVLQDLMESHPFLFPDFERKPDPYEPEYPEYARAGVPYIDPWGCVWKTPDSGIMGCVVEHPLVSWDAFEDYTPPDPDVTTHWGPIDWEKEAENIGPAISQKSLPNGEIGHNHTWLKLIDIRGYQNVLFDMADREPRLFQLLDMLEAFNSGLVRNYLKYGAAEWMGFAEDLGMQQGPMLSPGNFREYIKPSYQRLMGVARDAGCIIHVHADGDLRVLMDDLLDCGIDVIEHGTAIDEATAQQVVDTDRYIVRNCYTPIRVYKQTQGFTNQGEYSDWAFRRHKINYHHNQVSVRLCRQKGCKQAIGPDVTGCEPYNVIPKTMKAFMELGGYTGLEAISCCTQTGSEVMGLNDKIGTLEQDKFADLILVEGNPLRDVMVLAPKGNIRLVMKGGQTIINRSVPVS